MNARASRLHALERGLKAPRKSRAKARALTVMRLDGATTAARPNNARPARLPKDMEEQIAIVRGHAVGKPSRGLLQLEDRLLQSRAVDPTTPVIQRHEHASEPPSTAPAAQSYARATSLAASEFDRNYNVELFEDNSITTMPAPVLPAFRSEYSAGIAQAPAVAPPAATVSPYTGPPTAMSLQRAPERNHVARRSALTAEQEDVAANFQRDIAAMLGTPPATPMTENQEWDNAVRNASSAPAVAPPPAPEPATAPKQSGHEVFNQMGLAMNYANSFDLGAMDLSARFDHFDEELALSAKTSRAASVKPNSPSSVQAFALDDFDVIEDLAEISGAQSATPSANVSASEPCVKKEETPAPSPAPPQSPQ